jgi:hypothetical protein
LHAAARAVKRDVFVFICGFHVSPAVPAALSSQSQMSNQ